MNVNRVHESGQSINSVHQFNLLMNKAAMNLASSFSFNYGGNIYFSSYEDFWQQAIRASVIILAKARGRMVEWAA